MRLSVCPDVVTSPRPHDDRYQVDSFGKCLQNTPPLRVSGPKNKIFPKPEVSHKKVKFDVFALDIDFKLDLWVHITPLTDFASKKIQNQTGSAPKNSKNIYFFFFK